MQTTKAAPVASANGESLEFTTVFAFTENGEWRENSLAVDQWGGVWIGHDDSCFASQFRPIRRVSLADSVAWFRQLDPLANGHTGDLDGQTVWFAMIEGAIRRAGL